MDEYVLWIYVYWSIIGGLLPWKHGSYNNYCCCHRNFTHIISTVVAIETWQYTLCAFVCRRSMALHRSWQKNSTLKVKHELPVLYFSSEVIPPAGTKIVDRVNLSYVLSQWIHNWVWWFPFPRWCVTPV